MATNKATTKIGKPLTMEELLASQPQKLVTPFRGQEVAGKIVLITGNEIILDLGAKSEGVLSKRELPDPELKNLKVGDQLKTYVYTSENEHGQVVLSVQKHTSMTRFEGARLATKQSRAYLRSGKFIDWFKFINAQSQKSKLQGKVLEVNKGGLIVDIEGSRGFLPNSQVGFELLSKASKGLEDLVGQTLTVTVIEIDQNNNKLIFSQRGGVSDEVKDKLSEFKNDQKVTGKVVAVLPFGLVVDVNQVEGLVFISDVSWEKVEDLSKLYNVGERIEVMVTGLDEDLGRLNLSIKQLSEDPFAKVVDQYPADEVVTATVVGISDAGVVFKLAAGVEGLLPASKMESSVVYEPGKSISMLVDSIDTVRRRINLAPFITSTEGLIYK